MGPEGPASLSYSMKMIIDWNIWTSHLQERVETETSEWKKKTPGEINLTNKYKYLMGGNEWERLRPSSVASTDKRQWTKIHMTSHHNTRKYSAVRTSSIGTGCPGRLQRFPSVEILKNQVDIALGNPVQLTLFGQESWTTYLKRSFPSRQFCTSVKLLSTFP